MNKKEATQLAKVINYMGEGGTTQVWEANIESHFVGGWRILVKLNNTAYLHELNALMFVVDNTKKSGATQVVRDNNKVYWSIW